MIDLHGAKQLVLLQFGSPSCSVIYVNMFMEVLYVLVEDRESFILKITPFFLQSANIRKYLAAALQHRGIVPLTQWLLCKCVLKFSVVSTAG